MFTTIKSCKITLLLPHKTIYVRWNFVLPQWFLCNLGHVQSIFIIDCVCTDLTLDVKKIIWENFWLKPTNQPQFSGLGGRTLLVFLPSPSYNYLLWHFQMYSKTRYNKIKKILQPQMLWDVWGKFIDNYNYFNEYVSMVFITVFV